MGSLRIGDGLNDPIITNHRDDFYHAETQVFDSQFSPLPSPVEDTYETQALNLDGETQVLSFGDESQSLSLGGETQPLNLGDETQALNLGDETQALTQPLNLGGETQALNLGDETQALCYFDGIENMETQALGVFDNEVAHDNDNEGSDRIEVLGCGDGIENVETQLLDVFDNEAANDSDNEGSDRTEVLGGGDCISDGYQPLEKEKMQCSSVWEQGEKDLRKRSDGSNLEEFSHLFGYHDSTTTPVVQCTPQPEPGSVPRFTSIRAASLRASALAARSMASSEIDRESCYVLTNGLFSNTDSVRNNGLEPKDVEEIDQVNVLEKDNEKEKALRNGNKCRVGSSIVRKLFTEDSFSEDKRLPDNGDNSNGRENLPQFPVYDGELVGLSYVDSQDPGDLSQENALKFVETFIEKNNFVEFDHGVDHGKSTGGKLKPVSTAKGPQSLAKKSNDRSKVRETRIFDWDDSREDEGGGDIFCKYFANGCHLQRSLTRPRKLKKRKLDSYKNDKKQPAIHDEIMIQSDSRVTLHNEKRNEKKKGQAEMGVERNLANELDEQLNADSSKGQLEAVVSMMDMPQMLNVGPDTQIAAEAMEALLSGEVIANDDVKDLQNNSNSSEGKSKNQVSLKLSSSQTRVCLPDVDIATRQNKKTKRIGAELSKYSPVSSVQNFKNTRKKCDRESLIVKKKRAKSTAEAHSTINGSKNLDKAPSEIRTADTDVEVSEVLHARRKRCKLGSNQFGELENAKPSEHEQLDPGLTVMSSSVDTLRYPRGRRSCRNLSGQVSGFKKLDAQSKSSIQPEDIRQSITRHRRSRNNTKSTCADLTMNRKTRSSVLACAILSSKDRSSEGKLLGKSLNKAGSRNAAFDPSSADINDRKSLLDPQPSAGNAEMNSKLDKSPRDRCKPSDSTCNTPLSRMTPVNTVSPVCMGNEAQSCNVKEIGRLIATQPQPISPLKDLRKRRDMASIRVLFSRHLDEDIIKQQKKILGRLGASVATSIADATHFITDEFVRTRNMLEAIASGKPVVTHLWLESIGQVKVHIDEESYLLRDTKKEKEFGFTMPASFARALKHPLLQGQRVFITPNIKPNKETISSLVKAVHGQAVERLGRSGLKDDTVPDDLLILSCEEDYAICEPFLEKGAAVYSSELLLNGIVTQKLEYERHRLFADNVKRTRSTIWLRKDGHKFHRVTKLKWK